jgi:hypothetical protein
MGVKMKEAVREDSFYHQTTKTTKTTTNTPMQSAMLLLNQND